MRISDWSSDVCSSDLLRRVGQALDLADRTQDALGVTVRRVHHDDVDAGIEQRLGARQAVGADPSGGGSPQAALFVLAGVRIGLCLPHVLPGDAADADIVVVYPQQPLETVLWPQALRLLLDGARLHGDCQLPAHYLGAPPGG